MLFCSTRRDGRSLAHLARDELGKFGASAAMVGTLFIMVILIAVLALVVVKAMAHSAWSTATVFATIPIAILVGVYLRVLRPGRVLEATVIGVALLLLAVAAGGWVDRNPELARLVRPRRADARLVRDRLWPRRRDPAGLAAARAA